MTAFGDLATSLSEGDDPTDGNDFLFLIINHLVERHNVFCQSFKHFLSTKGDEEDEVQRQVHSFVVRWDCFLGTVMGLNFDVTRRDVYSNDLGVGLFKKPTRGPRRGLTKDSGGPHIKCCNRLSPPPAVPH